MQNTSGIRENQCNIVKIKIKNSIYDFSNKQLTYTKTCDNFLLSQTQIMCWLKSLIKSLSLCVKKTNQRINHNDGLFLIDFPQSVSGCRNDCLIECGSGEGTGAGCISNDAYALAYGHTERS